MIIIPQKMGYPRVRLTDPQNAGSVIDLERTLRKVKSSILYHRAMRDRHARRDCEEDMEWRMRIEAYNLLCDTSTDPRVDDFTGVRLQQCFDLLTDEIPCDFDIGFEEDGETRYPPRSGSNVPSQYYHGPGKTCMLDHHEDGAPDNPINLLPELVDLLSKNQSKPCYKECVFKLRDNRLIKVWIQVEHSLERIYPQLQQLLEKPLYNIMFYDNEPYPTTQLIECDVQRPLLLTHQDTEQRGVQQYGLTVEDTRAIQTSPDPETLRLDRLWDDIVTSKVEECLFLASSVEPHPKNIEEMLQLHMNILHLKDTEESVRTLVTYFSSKLKVGPRPLPKLKTSAALEDYISCDSLQSAIVKLCALQKFTAPNLDKLSLSKLEEVWQTIVA